MTFIDLLITPSINNYKSPCIIGFQKCGQTSLVEWLKQYYATVIKTESIHLLNGLNGFKELSPKYFPVIITRNRFDVIWSRYFHFGFNLKCTFTEYLHHTYRTVNPLYNTDYSLLIRPWFKYNPYVLSLEEVQKYPGFPHSNKSQNKKYIPLQPKQLNLIHKALSNYKSIKLLNK